MAIASNQVKPPMWAPGINWSHPLAKGLVFCAPMWFDTAAQIRDLSGLGRHLVPINTPVFQEDTKGKAWLFNAGATEYAAYNVDSPVTSYPFTMACWFNSSSATAGQTLMFVGATGTTNEFATLLAAGSTADDPVIAFSNSYGSAGGAKLATSASGYTVNKWHLACGVWVSRTERHVYIDGGNKGSNMESVDPISGHNSVAIGRSNDDSPGSYMAGHIMLPCIWCRAFSDAEVLQLYTDSWAIITPA